jgi:hypothetical protein
MNYFLPKTNFDLGAPRITSLRYAPLRNTGDFPIYTIYITLPIFPIFAYIY